MKQINLKTKSANPSRHSSMFDILRLVMLLAVLIGTPIAHAAVLVKVNNADALNLATSWTNNAAPTSADVLQWDATLSNVNNTTNVLGANLSVAGIKVVSPAGAIVITTNSGGNNLTLGASGIDMSGATRDLTLSNNIILPTNSSMMQTWTVPSGRTLSLQGNVTVTNNGAGLVTINNAGTINIAGNSPASSVWNRALVNGTDVGALDGSKNVSTVASVLAYTVNPAGFSGNPTTAYTDMVNGNTGTGADVALTATYANPRVIRFNTPQSSGRGYWLFNLASARIDVGAFSDLTILVTTNVGANDVVFTNGGTIGFRWSSSTLPSEFIIDQENTAGTLYISTRLSGNGTVANKLFTKRGAGRAVITGGGAAMGNSGPNRIAEGELMINATTFAGAVVDVNSGAKLSGTGVIMGPTTNGGAVWPGNNGVGVLTISNNLTLNSGSSLNFYSPAASPSTTTAPLNVQSNLVVGGSVSVAILAGSAPVGQYPLLKWTNSIAPGDFANFTLGQMPLRTQGYLSNNVANNSIDLVVTNVNQPIKWAVGNGTWDINTGSNWKDLLGNVTVYQQANGGADAVQFDDSATGSSPITITLNTNPVPASVTVNASKNYTISGSGSIGGFGSLTKSGSGTLTLSTANTFAGSVTLNGGTAVFSALNNLGAGTSLAFGGGTLQYNGNTDDVSVRTVTFNSGGATINDGGSTITFTKPVGNSGAGGLTKTGSGSLTLTGTNKYSGNTVVANGTLALAANTYISNSAAIIVNNGAVLDAITSGVNLNLNSAVSQILAGVGTVNGNVTVPSGTTLTPATNGVYGTISLGNDLTISGGALVVDVSTTNKDLVNVAGNLTISSGSLLVLTNTTALTNGSYKLIQYAGSLTGGAANLAIQGFNQSGKVAQLIDATPNEINLVISSVGGANLVWQGNDGTFPSNWDVATTANFTNSSGTAVIFAQGDNVRFDDTSANPNVNLMAGLQPSSVTVTANGNNYVMSDGTGIGTGKLGGSTTITKNGTSTLTIATANNNSGPTVINGGTVQVGNGGTLGDLGAGNVTNNGALVFYQSDDHSVSGTISGSGSLIQQGSGTVILTANNTYAGPTTITSGALQVGNGGASGSLGSGAITNDGTLIYNHSGSLTVGNIKAGPANQGALIFNGSASVTLNGGNTYINSTAISNGVVKLATANVIPSAATVAGSTGPLIVSGTGALDINGFDHAVNALSGGSYTSTITNSGASVATTNVITVLGSAGTTFRGVIAENASGSKMKLVVLGANELQLAATNTYSGGSLVGDTATIGLWGNGPLGSGSLVLSNGTTMSLHNGGGVNAGITAPIYIPDNSAATFISTFQGNSISSLINGSATATNVIGGTAAVSFAPQNTKQWQSFLGTVVINTGAKIRFAPTSGLANGGDTTTFEIHGTIQGKGGGAVSLGALQGDGSVAAPTEANGTTTYTIGSKNLSTVFSGTINSSSPTNDCAVTKTGAGTLVLDGTLTYGGATVVNGGVLQIASISNPSTALDSSPTITVTSNAVLDVSARSDSALNLGSSIAQTLSGYGTVRGSLNEAANSTVSVGLGTLTITNVATLNGALVMQLNRTNVTTASKLVAGSLVNASALTVTNVGSALQNGDTFQLFNGAVTGFTVTNLPALTGTLYWTNKLAIDGSLAVLTTSFPPTNSASIAGISLVGNDLIMSGTNGNNGATYYLLASTNLATALPQWRTIWTNVMSVSGPTFSFSFVATNGVGLGRSQRFYILSSTNYNP